MHWLSVSVHALTPTTCECACINYVWVCMHWLHLSVHPLTPTTMCECMHRLCVSVHALTPTTTHECACTDPHNYAWVCMHWVTLAHLATDAERIIHLEQCKSAAVHWLKYNNPMMQAVSPLCGQQISSGTATERSWSEPPWWGRTAHEEPPATTATEKVQTCPNSDAHIIYYSHLKS